jgi:SecD/SecF fusion protein
LYAIRDYSMKQKPKLDGGSIVDASQDFDQFGEVTVSMNMDNEGAIKWGQMTRDAAKENDAVAIVMDNLVYSAPTVNEEIPSGRSQITMGTGNIQSQLQDAKDLADLLKAGALPARAKIVDESVVGPSLGKENIKAGMISFGVALLVVLLYMIFYYKGAGVVSDIALIANLIFLIGALASLGAALTLPGIAGIVLTIGMAVDANVLIYERIKEEMRLGKGLILAVKDGYQRAYSAIIDANITTLLTAIVLLAFGTGPIRGFATTLIIGIFTSLFSAILITRLIFFNRLEKKKSISFYTDITKDWFTNINFEFVKKRKIFYGISSLVIVIGLVSMFTKGFDQGVDFQGGRSYVIRFDDAPNMEQLRDNLSVAFTENGSAGNPEVKRYGSSGQAVKITTPFMIKSDNPEADAMVQAKLDEGLTKSGLSYKIEESQKVDPTISDDFRDGARNATIFALLIIFLYIFFRFRKWQFGLGALIAMIHDVLIVMSLFSILAGIMPFTMEIDQAFIAAILTVIGYSINDTVVVFDRIREYLKEHKKDSTDVVINKALNSTLSRTINTSLSTFVVLLVIFAFGPSNIMGFIFALMVGIVVGTYSSIFIATPVVIDLSKNLEK